MERTTLTVADVAQMLGISPNTIYSMVREKKIPQRINLGMVGTARNQN